MIELDFFLSEYLRHTQTMIYGYADLSTVAQGLTNQVTQLKAAGSAIIFREKVSGATAERPELKKLTAKLAK
jgi:DNA invertase Pin-like site-specific DNA recombinase